MSLYTFRNTSAMTYHRQAHGHRAAMRNTCLRLMPVKPFHPRLVDLRGTHTQAQTESTPERDYPLEAATGLGSWVSLRQHPRG